MIIIDVGLGFSFFFHVHTRRDEKCSLSRPRKMWWSTATVNVDKKEKRFFFLINIILFFNIVFLGYQCQPALKNEWTTVIFFLSMSFRILALTICGYKLSTYYWALIKSKTVFEVSTIFQALNWCPEQHKNNGPLFMGSAHRVHQ